MLSMAVETEHGWADVIALIRDLRGYKVIVWQDRTGTIGTMFASDARVRVNDHIIQLDNGD
jgi:hypothetical protein